MTGGWIAASLAVVFFPTVIAFIGKKAEAVCDELENIDDGVFLEEPLLRSYNFDED